MTDRDDLLVRVLHGCAQAVPAPLFPPEFAASTGIDRARIDTAVDRLRVGGFIQIADWVQGKGQGYGLTPAGAAALEQPRLLSRPAAPAPPVIEVPDRPNSWERSEAVRESLLHPARPIVTFSLILACWIVYAVGFSIALARGGTAGDYFSGKTEAAVVNEKLGALDPERVIIENEWWRVVSYQFLHGSLMHILLNMLSLYFIGPFLETIWGSRRFLVLYLLSGVVGGAAVIMTGRGAVGASGSIVGLLTSLGVWIWMNRGSLAPQYVSHVLSRVGLNLMLLVFMSMGTRVSWEGHLGGAIGGVLLSIPLQFERFAHGWRRAMWWAMIAAIPLASLAVAYEWQQGTMRWRQLLVEMNRVEDVAFESHNEYVVPMLHDRLGGWRQDPVFVAKAQKAFSEALEVLKPMNEKIGDWKTRGGSESQEAQEVSRYFDALVKEFEAAQRELENANPWDPAGVKALNAQAVKTLELRRDTVLESMRPLQRQAGGRRKQE